MSAEIADVIDGLDEPAGWQPHETKMLALEMAVEICTAAESRQVSPSPERVINVARAFEAYLTEGLVLGVDFGRRVNVATVR